MSELKQILINYINKPKNDFRILFPIQTIGGALKKKRWFNIQNTKFIISDWKRIHELKGWQDFADHAKSIKYLASNLKEQIVPMHQYFSPLLVTARARNHSEAFHSTNRKYEVMRAILNLSYKHGQITLQAGPPQPLGAILPPIFYGIFDKNGNYINLYFNEETYI